MEARNLGALGLVATLTSGCGDNPDVANILKETMREVATCTNTHVVSFRIQGEHVDTSSIGLENLADFVKKETPIKVSTIQKGEELAIGARQLDLNINTGTWDSLRVAQYDGNNSLGIIGNAACIKAQIDKEIEKVKDQNCGVTTYSATLSGTSLGIVIPVADCAE